MLEFFIYLVFFFQLLFISIKIVPYISPLSAQIGFITSFFVLGEGFVKLFSSNVKMEKS